MNFNHIGRTSLLLFLLPFFINATDNLKEDVNLLEQPACPELASLCSNLKPRSENIHVLECLQTFHTNQDLALSEKCQHIIWTQTKNLMEDDNVFELLNKSCPKDSLKECNQLKKSSPKQEHFFLKCILDHRENFKDGHCIAQIQRIESVAFSDFRLIGMFLKNCENDIEKYSCGRIQERNRQKLSQGEVINCLQNNIGNLNDMCKSGILHVSELQAENFKFDKQLYASCNSDSMIFCPDVKPGSGQVVKCLMRNKNDVKMSQQCQDQLQRNVKLIAQNYKISRGLARACKEDIKQNHCRRGVSDDKDVRLAQILLCLEAAQKNNTKIIPECLAEISDHRKLLMGDFNLSPEIIADCTDDMKKFCPEKMGTLILHCLMEQIRGSRTKKENRVSSQCQRAVEQLIKISEVNEDWRVDPVLKSACKTVVDIACKDIEVAGTHNCLMEKLGTKYMTEKCEIALLQIQYFIARDFKLDPQLYSNCKDDAIKFCHAKKSWADMEQKTGPERGPMILPCLHRYAYHPEQRMQLSQDCFQEIKRVMRQRAVSVDLIPEVEEECLEDLSLYCFEKTGRGEEMQCLQDNLEKVTAECKKVVISYTEEQAAYIELNPIILSVCGGPMQKYCENVLNTGNDEGEVMECLISHKNDVDLRQNVKCRAAIEHFQIISLKNYVFTYKFKNFCRPHVTRFCPKSNTKYDVVACLSEVMRNDTIKGSRHSIPKECRQQVRAQLYQQRENIDFDPKLKAACSEDIERYCFNIPHESGQVLECLQTRSGALNQKCGHYLFSIKKSEMLDSATDYTLMTTCKGMLKQFCGDTEPSKALHCLKIHKDEPLFDNQCHLVVVNRMIEQNMDYRFNPILTQACSKNIADYCTKIVAKAKQDEELNGKVIQCLKQKFREAKLNVKCEKQMTGILREQALNYKLDPLLSSMCKNEIKVLCSNGGEIDETGENDNGQIEECLKREFLAKRIISIECKIEVATLIQESHADIHVDPILQSACVVDLLKYCSNINSGNGRHLKCLQVIMEDESKALEDDCKKKLQQRMEMFKNAADIVPQAESLTALYSQIADSPAKRYLSIVLLTIVAAIFVFGMFCGRVTRRSTQMKNK